MGNSTLVSYENIVQYLALASDILGNLDNNMFKAELKKDDKTYIALDTSNRADIIKAYAGVEAAVDLINALRAELAELKKGV